MKLDYDLSKVEEAGEFTRVTAGGYVCQITKVEDKADKQYLRVEFDIVEGDFRGYAASTAERAGFWPLSFIRSYKQTAAGFFKQFINAVEKTNKNYKFESNEQTLVKKGIGLVLGEEEYEKRDGSIGTRVYVSRITTANDIREGNFTVPEFKKMESAPAPVAKSTPAAESADDDDYIPF